MQNLNPQIQSLNAKSESLKMALKEEHEWECSNQMLKWKGLNYIMQWEAESIFKKIHFQLYVNEEVCPEVRREV